MTLSFCASCCGSFIAALTIWAAITDIGYRLIPNRISMMAGVFGLIVAAFEGHVGTSALCGCALLLVLLGLWHFGMMGGGDVKLIAALSLGLTGREILVLLLDIMIAGSVLAFVYIGLRKVMSNNPCSGRGTGPIRFLRVEKWRIRRGGSLPYAVAIMAGFVFLKVR